MARAIIRKPDGTGIDRKSERMKQCHKRKENWIVIPHQPCRKEKKLF